MPFKDPARMAEYMRARRSEAKNRVNVTPNVNRKPVNPRFSMVSGAYEDGFWVGICPRCNHHNRLDPKRSFRPENVCEHYQQLETPGTSSPLLFRKVRGKVNTVNVNPLTQRVNPVAKEKYLLSYSRKKYQFVLYSVDSEGKKSLVRSYAKGETVILGNVQIELTWRPDSEIANDLQEVTEK